MLWVTPILEIKCSPVFLLYDCSRVVTPCPLPLKPLLFASHEIQAHRTSERTKG